jgi:hypothetical protein
VYDNLIETLSRQKFIYDNNSKNLFYKDEIIIADGFGKKLFPNNQLKGKRLLYIDNARTANWLVGEFKIERLKFKDIEENIEEECGRQAKVKNIRFFKDLYEYVDKNPGLNLSGKKVLVTDDFHLYQRADDVFNGMERSENIILTKQIRTRIHFLHKEIDFDEPRRIQERLGFIEYNATTLVRRLIKLFIDDKIPKLDILKAILSVKPVAGLAAYIRQNIMLPVVKPDRTEWVKPLNSPVYIESPQLRELYPTGNFIDLNLIADGGSIGNVAFQRLIDYGAWTIPAIYFSDKLRTINTGNSNYIILDRLSDLTTSVYLLQWDWILDLPATFTEWFTNTIVQSWNTYKQIFSDDQFGKASYKSLHSGTKYISPGYLFKISSFFVSLKSLTWINLSGKNYSVSNIIAVNPADKNQRINLLNQYFPLLFIDQHLNASFIHDLNVNHLDEKSYENFKRILLLAKKSFPQPPMPDEPFRKAYNVFLNKLFEFYNSGNREKGELLALNAIPFLARDEFTGISMWLAAKNIYYVDSRIAFEAYPQTVQQLLQPQFSTMDKNRFGQIGRQIGINFRTAVTERLGSYIVVAETPINRFVPLLAQCLALIESKDDQPTLDSIIFSTLSSLIVKRCPSIKVEILRNGDVIDSFYPTFKIQAEKKSFEVLAITTIADEQGQANAALLSTILDEIINKDYQRFEGMLIDFYAAPEKTAYLKRNQVDPDRIAEISEILEEKTLSPKQNFWEHLLRLNIAAQTEIWITESGIDPIATAKLLSITSNLTSEIDVKLRYERLNDPENIPLFQKLIDELGLSYSDFLMKTDLHINFFSYYNEKYRSIRLAARESFETALYLYFTGKPTKEQERFTAILINFDHLFYHGGGELKDEVERLFRQDTIRLLPQLKFSLTGSNILPAPLNKIYEGHRTSLYEACNKMALNTELLETYLTINKERSLLYFGQVKELTKRYGEWSAEKKPSPAGKSGTGKPLIDTSQYFGEQSEEIDQNKTKATGDALPSDPTDDGSKGKGNGRRMKGGSNQAQNDLVGLVAEKAVFRSLRKKYKIVKWISANAADDGENPEGKDGAGYDLEYIGHDGKIHYVEVKGTSGNTNYFFIDATEVDRAKKEKAYYHLLFVKFALEKSRRKITDLGNPFLITPGESIFNNGNYTAVFDTLKITFDAV